MYKHLMGFMVIVFIIVIIACASYFTFSYFAPPAQKPAITPVQQLVGNENKEEILIEPETVIRREKIYDCGDPVIEYQGPAPDSLHGLTENELRQLYSEEDNWEISKLENGIVVLSKNSSELCDEHSNYKHLGIHNGMLAVYKGPLGYDKKLERVERNIKIKELPGQYKLNLQRAMNFEEQNHSTKLDLRKEFEFRSEENLNTVLETFDEY